MSDKNQTKTTLRIDGTMPMLPTLAEVTPEAPAFLNQLASEFAATATQLQTQQAYWIALNGWITDRLSGAIMETEVSNDSLREYTWAVLVTAYWGGVELRENWGMPPAMERLGIAVQPPFPETQQTIIDTLGMRLAAVEAGSDACLHILPSLLHEDTATGALWSTAYNAGCQVLKAEDPPVGERRPNRPQRPSMVRINPRDFLRVDYELPTPNYLRVLRSAFEAAVTANPEAYEKVIAGEHDQANLRDLWKRGVEFCHTTWGEGANDKWTDAYYDEALHWSTVVNFGLEATSLAAFVALINQDADAAKRAVMGNAIYVGAPFGWLMGMLDTGAKLPAVSPA